MATITERAGYHILNWTDPQDIDPKTGKPRRHRRSLGRVGSIPKRELDQILQAKEYELSTGARLLNAHRRPAPRFSDFVAEYKLWHQDEYPDSTYRVQQIIDDHLEPEFGPTPLNLLTPEQADAWKNKRRFLVRASTVTKELRVLMAILNRAVELKRIAENPLTAVKAPPQLDSRPHHYYQAEELTRIYSQSAWGPYWRFMANTGLRRGEALIMRRMWITDAVRIQSTGEERTKAGTWRKIPLTAGARAALAEIPDNGEYLFPRVAPESLSRAFTRDARRESLPGSLHSLRHSYICHLLLAQVPVRTVQLYAGHAHITTTEKYAYQVLGRDPEQALGLAI